MKELLNEWIAKYNEAVDNRDRTAQYPEMKDISEYWRGKAMAYVDTLVDLAVALNIDTDIDDTTKHIYIKK